MLALVKNDWRFWYVMWEAQHALMLGNIEISYWNMNRYGGDRWADCSYDRNWKTARIRFFDEFYDTDWSTQMRAVIHEHVHCVLWRYVEFATGVVMASRRTKAMKAVWQECGDSELENTVRYLTEVFYDLLESRLAAIG